MCACTAPSPHLPPSHGLLLTQQTQTGGLGGAWPSLLRAQQALPCGAGPGHSQPAALPSILERYTQLLLKTHLKNELISY